MSFDFLSLALPGVRGLVPYEPGKPIETLERELGIRNSLKLASNENPLGPSPKALQAVQSALTTLALYPDGAGFALKEAIACRIGMKSGGVTLGNGSNEILELVARAFLGPGTNAVFSRHAFAVYPLVTQAAGAELREAPALPAAHDQPYGHDLAALRARVDAHTRVVFVANPNNPTGTWLDVQALKAFVASLPKNVLVVIDEAYCEYVDRPGYPDASHWLCEFPNLLVTRTFSKIYGLAGLRVGYGLSSVEISQVLNRVRQPFNTNTLAQVAALAALGDEEHVRRSRELNKAGLAQMETAMHARGLPYIPSVGNFISVDVGRPAQEVYQAMLRQGVIVRPIANYGFPQHLRFTIGSAPENERLLAALDQALAA